ncbi:GNAT family N-acetyltransferase [Sphingobium subterraneum]|uniref:GNAT superfamily N-acetyltransferase n=1 Tax=Sphingobium subterraneum TaxID=627688 RepID=A0A841IYV3_9SPHN|nr:GNAT family N-acetyltransferase [Sphingobium subterraneum]MBB6123843.1 GNAT superfamily N-acetyltransferase [Sphingobium subterraneum]
MSIQPVPPGHLAAVVTTLEMTQRPAPAPLPFSPLRLVRWKAPELEKYRTLFRRVGAPWLWFSRLVMDDAAVRAIIEDPAVEIYAITDPHGIEIGLLELDFRTEGICMIAFLGLVPQLAGQGHGVWLMAHTRMLAWRKGVERVRVRTCSLDHPAALPFYRKADFVATGREIETFADPRLSGILPREAGAHIPLLETSEKDNPGARSP